MHERPLRSANVPDHDSNESAAPSSADGALNDAATQRRSELETWIAARFPGTRLSIAPASADASFRRYFRVQFRDGQRDSLIVMDAPPAHEDCRPFIHVAELFAQAGVHVPRVLDQDLERGFLLLADLGNTTYLAALDDSNAESLYGDALAALVQIQSASRPDALPVYDRALLARELALFPDWYIAQQLRKPLSDDQRNVLHRAFERLLANNLAQSRVFVHRDYHSRNLMHTTPNPGILDFQDAVCGPVTYDLVSLLRDAYIAWDEARQLDWCARYWTMARKAGVPVGDDFGEFYRDFEWMGVQRQLKVVGIFARLCYRDGKQQYLQDQPRVLQYLHAACARYNELGELARLLDTLAERRAQVGYSF